MTQFDDSRLKSGQDGSGGIEFDARKTLRGKFDDARLEQVVGVDE